MPVLETVTALLTAGAPPAIVPDARMAVAVYCEQTCDVDAMSDLETKLGERFEIKDTLPREAKSDRLALTLLRADEFGQPDAAVLDTFGVGLTSADAAALAGSAEVVVMEVAVPTGGAAMAQKTLNAAALGFATSQNGWLEDLETREVFSRDQWQSLRVDTLHNRAAVWDLVRIESYPQGDDGLERMVTYGLDKFGLHEISVSDVHPDFTDDLAATLLLMAAAGVEGRSFTDNYTLDLAGLKNSEARAWLSGYLWEAGDPGVMLPGAGGATVRLLRATPQEGDNPSPQVQLIPTGAGSQSENLGALLDTLWGYGATPSPEAVVADASGGAPMSAAGVDIESPDDAVVFILIPDDSGGASDASGDADSSLEAASAAARQTLNTSVKARWEAGLPAGSQLVVKAPFRNPAGAVEWMWVEVTGWSGAALRGELLNQPQDIADLNRGDAVAVSGDEVFDYLLRGPDGATEGGATEDLLR